jgi:hypothetical protein
MVSCIGLTTTNWLPRKDPEVPRHLNWLEAFAAAVGAGSLEGAAEHLGVARQSLRVHDGLPLR